MAPFRPQNLHPLSDLSVRSDFLTDTFVWDVTSSRRVADVSPSTGQTCNEKKDTVDSAETLVTTVLNTRHRIYSVDERGWGRTVNMTRTRRSERGPGDCKIVRINPFRPDQVILKLRVYFRSTAKIFNRSALNSGPEKNCRRGPN